MRGWMMPWWSMGGVDDAMVDDEEVVDEKLQLDVDTVVELHFHVLLLGI